MASGVVLPQLLLAVLAFAPAAASFLPAANTSHSLSSSSSTSMSQQTHEFYCGMTCDGCKNAITRIVTRIPGVSKLEADVPTKRVLVTGTASKDELHEKLSKWGQASGKEVRYVKTL